MAWPKVVASSAVSCVVVTVMVTRNPGSQVDFTTGATLIALMTGAAAEMSEQAKDLLSMTAAFSAESHAISHGAYENCDCI